VEEELLLRIDYLVAENRILRDQIKGRIQLTDAQRRSLAEVGTKLSKQALNEIAHIVKPDSILAWHLKLVLRTATGASVGSAEYVGLAALKLPTDFCRGGLVAQKF